MLGLKYSMISLFLLAINSIWGHLYIKNRNESGHLKCYLDGILEECDDADDFLELAKPWSITKNYANSTIINDPPYVGISERRDGLVGGHLGLSITNNHTRERCFLCEYLESIVKAKHPIRKRFLHMEVAEDIPLGNFRIRFFLLTHDCMLVIGATASSLSVMLYFGNCLGIILERPPNEYTGKMKLDQAINNQLAKLKKTGSLLFEDFCYHQGRVYFVLAQIINSGAIFVVDVATDTVNMALIMDKHFQLVMDYVTRPAGQDGIIFFIIQQGKKKGVGHVSAEAIFQGGKIPCSSGIDQVSYETLSKDLFYNKPFSADNSLYYYGEDVLQILSIVPWKYRHLIVIYVDQGREIKVELNGPLQQTRLSIPLLLEKKYLRKRKLYRQIEYPRTSLSHAQRPIFVFQDYQRGMGYYITELKLPEVSERITRHDRSQIVGSLSRLILKAQDFFPITSVRTEYCSVNNICKAIDFSPADQSYWDTFSILRPDVHSYKLTSTTQFIPRPEFASELRTTEANLTRALCQHSLNHDVVNEMLVFSLDEYFCHEKIEYFKIIRPAVFDEQRIVKRELGHFVTKLSELKEFLPLKNSYLHRTISQKYRTYLIDLGSRGVKRERRQAIQMVGFSENYSIRFNSITVKTSKYLEWMKLKTYGKAPAGFEVTLAMNRQIHPANRPTEAVLSVYGYTKFRLKCNFTRSSVLKFRQGYTTYQPRLHSLNNNYIALSLMVSNHVKELKNFTISNGVLGEEVDVALSERVFDVFYIPPTTTSPTTTAPPEIEYNFVLVVVCSILGTLLCFGVVMLIAFYIKNYYLLTYKSGIPLDENELPEHLSVFLMHAYADVEIEDSDEQEEVLCQESAAFNPYSQHDQNLQGRPPKETFAIRGTRALILSAYNPPRSILKGSKMSEHGSYIEPHEKEDSRN